MREVDKGHEFLNRNVPGWKEQITRQVKVQNPWDCPLGQVFGYFFDAYDFLKDTEGDAFTNSPMEWAEAHGFMPTWITGEGNSASQLDAAWNAILNP